MDRHLLLALAVISAYYAVAGHAYASVWRSDVTLWQHAHVKAPLLVRPFLNLEKALASQSLR